MESGEVTIWCLAASIVVGVGASSYCSYNQGMRKTPYGSVQITDNVNFFRTEGPCSVHMTDNDRNLTLDTKLKSCAAPQGRAIFSQKITQQDQVQYLLAMDWLQEIYPADYKKIVQ